MDIEVKAVCLVLCFLYSVAYFGHQSDNNFFARSISRRYDCEAFVHAKFFRVLIKAQSPHIKYHIEIEAFELVTT